jgi:hypothetical protein
MPELKEVGDVKVGIEVINSIEVNVLCGIEVINSEIYIRYTY